MKANVKQKFRFATKSNILNQGFYGNKKLNLEVGIFGNKKLQDIALKLDHGTNEIIQIPKKVFAVVPEAKEMGITSWDGIPARPFLEQTLHQYWDSWLLLFRELFDWQKNNEIEALHQVGKVAVQDMQRVIGTTNWHPNSEIWRLYKERTGTNESPLMYKERMYKAVGYKIIK